MCFLVCQHLVFADARLKAITEWWCCRKYSFLLPKNPNFMGQTSRVFTGSTRADAIREFDKVRTEADETPDVQ